MTDVKKKSPNGRIFICDQCSAIHIEYKNLSFTFTERKFQSFAQDIRQIYVKVKTGIYRDSLSSKKIMIPTGLSSFNIILDEEDLDELMELLWYNEDPVPTCESIKACDLSFTSFNN